jgi:hypothetical protein
MWLRHPAVGECRGQLRTGSPLPAGMSHRAVNVALVFALFKVLSFVMAGFALGEGKLNFNSMVFPIRSECH